MINLSIQYMIQYMKKIYGNHTVVNDLKTRGPIRPTEVVTMPYQGNRWNLKSKVSHVSILRTNCARQIGLDRKIEGYTGVTYLPTIRKNIFITQRSLFLYNSTVLFCSFFFKLRDVCCLNILIIVKLCLSIYITFRGDGVIG